ncbi:MAG: hypothetical protein ACOC0M_05860 [Halomonas sp.]
MHTHQLLDHPLFEERPIREVLAPFGFEVSVETIEPPVDPAIDDDLAVDAYAEDPQAYIDSLNFQHPLGFTEICRGEDEDNIFSVAVMAKTVFAQLLLCADSAFAGPSSPIDHSYFDVYCERMRQLSTEGWSRDHDDGHTQGEKRRAQVEALVQLMEDWIDCKHDHLPWPEFIDRRITELGGEGS